MRHFAKPRTRPLHAVCDCNYIICRFCGNRKQNVFANCLLSYIYFLPRKIAKNAFLTFKTVFRTCKRRVFRGGKPLNRAGQIAPKRKQSGWGLRGGKKHRFGVEVSSLLLHRGAWEPPMKTDFQGQRTFEKPHANNTACRK